ncbi:hypothetical protein BDD12DRAFT_885372 [Trichophaea hybrida]|nr:hypothetical protein BDD12DRAFT_885372 [Trichophaea hybrida]
MNYHLLIHNCLQQGVTLGILKTSNLFLRKRLLLLQKQLDQGFHCILEPVSVSIGICLGLRVSGSVSVSVSVGLRISLRLGLHWYPYWSPSVCFSISVSVSIGICLGFRVSVFSAQPLSPNHTCEPIDPTSAEDTADESRDLTILNTEDEDVPRRKRLLRRMRPLWRKKRQFQIMTWSTV